MANKPLNLNLLTGYSPRWLNLFARRVVCLPDRLLKSTPLSVCHFFTSDKALKVLCQVRLQRHLPSELLPFLPVMVVCMEQFTQQLYDHNKVPNSLPHDASESWVIIVTC